MRNVKRRIAALIATLALAAGAFVGLTFTSAPAEAACTDSASSSYVWTGSASTSYYRWTFKSCPSTNPSAVDWVQLRVDNATDSACKSVRQGQTGSFTHDPASEWFWNAASGNAHQVVRCNGTSGAIIYPPGGGGGVW